MSEAVQASIVAGVFFLLGLLVKDYLDQRRAGRLERISRKANEAAVQSRRDLASQVEQVRKSTNSLTDKLVAQAADAGMAQGALQERDRQDTAVLDKLHKDYQTVWEGIVARGYLEAQQLGHLILRNGVWVVSDRAYAHYRGIAEQLCGLRAALKAKLGREPGEQEFTWEVEQDKELRQWILDNACPPLQTTRHGCLAIACEIARSKEGRQ